MSEWIPDISNIAGPRYLALVTALQNDISEGKLKNGMRLPTHRKLAKLLNITVGTISRAYAETGRRGLTHGEIGRGTFVSVPMPQNHTIAKVIDHNHAEGMIDFAILRANESIYQDVVCEGLMRLSTLPELSIYLSFLKIEGFLEHRQSACNWLMHYGIPNVKPKNIVYTSGAQHAISVSIAALSEPGELILCEEICYTGIKGVATQLHRRHLMGIPIDQQGIIPEQLRLICQSSNAKVLVCCPNHQNPTTAILSYERRLEIVEIAREFDLKIIEDDVFNYLHSNIPSLVELAPERTVYVTGMSKSLFVGIRLGIIYTKSPYFDLIATSVRTSLWTPSPIITQLFSMWVNEGIAFKLADAQAKEAQERQKIARAILLNSDLTENLNSPHLWLKLPVEWDMQTFFNAALRHRVSVVAGDQFMMTHSEPQISAVRLCLLSPNSREEMVVGLKIIQKLLNNPKHIPQFTII